MAGFDTIELDTGYAVWMRCIHAALGLLALAGIAGSGAPPLLVAAAVACLIVSFAADAWRMHRLANAGSLRLCGDRALLQSSDGRQCPAALRQGAWVSRWFCLLRLRSVPDGRRLCRVVCRCRNRPEDYRRLLVRLRFGVTDRDAPVWMT